MNPNLIHLDWERAGESLALAVAFSFIVVRVLAIVFENKIWIRNVQVDGLNEIIALLVSIVACVVWKFKAFADLAPDRAWRDWHASQKSAEDRGVLDIEDNNPFYDFHLI